MKKVIILFGEMGAGKNYWGTQLSNTTGFPFFDGDTVATPQMIERVSQFKPLTRGMIENYIDVLCNAIADMMQNCDELLVAQALYFDEDRKRIALFLSSLGYKTDFYWVRTSAWKNAKQLLTRPNGWKWVCYWLFNKPWFQKPTHPYQIIKV